MYLYLHQNIFQVIAIFQIAWLTHLYLNAPHPPHLSPAAPKRGYKLPRHLLFSGSFCTPVAISRSQDIKSSKPSGVCVCDFKEYFLQV
jgi:hypothetical protein